MADHYIFIFNRVYRTAIIFNISISDFGGKSPTVRESKLVFVWQNTFCRTKTQLALFVWTENLHKVDCDSMPIYSYKIESYLPDEKCKYQFVCDKPYSYKIESYLPDEKCKYQFVCDKPVCRVEYRVNGVPDI